MFSQGITAMFLTGFSGLLYQVLWIRVFSTLLGGTTLSISCVIAHFMLGLGLGTAWAPRLLNKSFRKEIPLYSYCEFAIVFIVAVSFSVLAGNTEELTQWLQGFSGSSSAAQLLSHFLITGVFIFPATFLMGLSFPVISYKFAEASQHQWLYAVNCLGGAVGALLSYTLLIYNFGLQNTLRVGLVLNLLAGVLFLRYRFQTGKSAATSDAKAADLSIEGLSAKTIKLWALGLSGLSGFFVLSLEQLWFRLSALMLGGRVYVHSLVLAVLLLSLAVGAGISPRWKTLRVTDQISRLIYLMLAAVSSIAVGFLFFDYTMSLSVDLVSPYHKTLHAVFIFSLLFLAVIPGTVLGLCFPLSLRLIQAGEDSALSRTRSLSRAIYVNTFASVLGSLLATYVLFRVLGTVNSLKFLSCILVLLALLGALVFTKDKKRAVTVLCGLVLLGFLIFKPLSLNSAEQVLFEAEDEFGYLSLVKLKATPAQPEVTRWAMFNNFSSLVAPYGYAKTQVVQKNLALYPALFSKELNNVLVVGMGYGLTTEAFAKLPVTTAITSVELLPLVLKAQEKMTFKNNDYLQDPRVHNIATDGRSYVALSGKKWDVLTVNVDPYGVGTTHLMSQEFYKIVTENLAPGGVYAQLLFGSQYSIQALINTAKQSFPHYKILPGYDYDGIIFLGKIEPFSSWELASWGRVNKLMPSQSWDQDGLHTPQDFDVAEKVANSWIEYIGREAGVNEGVVTDDNLAVEKSRTSIGDLFLNYPKDY
ncbi:fused MFS/spermidine synthase [Bdellovibrio sp. HCB274]|uniref:fused MFS/spermidine synthase n=1 Tax=Bdellovibrio sp. HCB274 TaxID=3394361 RepID=UPI0039B68A22